MRRYNRPDDYRNNNYDNRQNQSYNRYDERFAEQQYQQQRNNFRQPPPQPRRYNEDDYLKTTYDIANYSGIPESENYGRLHPHQEYGPQIEPFPDTRNWYERAEHYQQHRHTYHGFDPNYDNPEEGERYRSWDMRGNHGYRHDPSYGHSDNMIGYNDAPYELEREKRRNRRDDYWW